MSDDERAVLGDALMQAGDPLGELIGVSLALEALPADAPTVRRNLIARKFAALLDQHHDALYGPLARFVNRASRPDRFDPALEVRRWHGGFADTIWVQTTRSEIQLADVVRALRDLPIARFLRRLEVGEGDHSSAIAAIELPSLRELVVGDASRALPMLRTNPVATTAAFDALANQLELLHVQTPIELAPMQSTSLRDVSLYRTSEPFTLPTRIFDASLPELEAIRLLGFRIDRDFFARYPRLRRLEINARLEPDWLEHFLMSPAIERIEHAEIGFGLGDADLSTVARLVHRIAHMKRLDLRANYFSNEARQAAQLPPNVLLR